MSNPNGAFAKAMRWFSVYLTRLFLCTSITANQVSIMVLFLGLASVVLFMSGQWVIGSAVLLSAHALDYVDGSIARHRKCFTLKGIWLENTFHRIMPSLIIFGVGFGLSEISITYLYIGIAASFSWIIFNYISEMRRNVMLQNNGTYNNPRTNYIKKSNVMIRLYEFILSDEWMAIFILGAAALDTLPLLLVCYGIFIPIRSFVLLMMLFIKK